MRQVFPYSAREIWVFVRSAGTFVDVTPLFEFDERKAAGGDEVSFIQQLVGFAVDQNTPVPRDALKYGPLGPDVGSAVGGNGIIPEWVSVQDIKSL